MLGSSGVLRRLPGAMHNRDFALLVLGSLVTNLATQMIAVAIGWQVYDIHHRPFDLGLVGLLEFGPVFILALPAGALIDRVSRKLMLAARHDPPGRDRGRADRSSATPAHTSSGRSSRSPRQSAWRRRSRSRRCARSRRCS